MSKLDKHSVPDMMNQDGPPVVAVSFNNTNENQNCVSGCCPCPPPTPGGGGAYVTQIYASKDGDGGVQVQRKGSAVVLSHKTYDTIETEVESSDIVISDIQVVNGHIVAVERALIGDLIDSKIEEAVAPFEERLSTVEHEVTEIEQEFEPKVKEALDKVLPEALETDVPVIMKERLKEQLVDTDGNILLSALTDPQGAEGANIFTEAFNAVVNGVISGGAPLPTEE